MYWIQTRPFNTFPSNLPVPLILIFQLFRLQKQKKNTPSQPGQTVWSIVSHLIIQTKKNTKNKLKKKWYSTGYTLQSYLKFQKEKKKRQNTQKAFLLFIDWVSFTKCTWPFQWSSFPRTFQRPAWSVLWCYALLHCVLNYRFLQRSQHDIQHFMNGYQSALLIPQMEVT